jgi:hypothetical protein
MVSFALRSRYPRVESPWYPLDWRLDEPQGQSGLCGLEKILLRFRLVTVRRGLDRMIGFIGTLYVSLRSTLKYSAIADLHTLQFTVTHTLVSSVFTSRILATDL